MDRVTPDDQLALDPVVCAEKLLACFDDRERLILEQRVLHCGGKDKRTLDNIGEQFGVSRQRVSQLEKRIKNWIEEKLEDEEYEPIRQAADELSQRIGPICGAGELPAILGTAPHSLRDKLFMYLAGPYLLTERWLVREDIGSVEGSVEDTVLRWFCKSGDGEAATLDAMRDVMTSAGVNREFQIELIEEHSSLRLRRNLVILWTGGLREKSIRILREAGEPMSTMELFQEIEEDKSPRSLSGVLQRGASRCNCPIQSVGVSRWGLVEWGLDSYDGIVPVMSRLLEERGEIPVQDIADQLAEKFKVSRSSVATYAKAHYRFIVDNGVLRLRRADEPYIPKRDLEYRRDCYVVGGYWALRKKIDADIMRGAGRAIPEEFAVYLGVQPGMKRSVNFSSRKISVGWPSAPNIGSIRTVVLDLQGKEGDYVFIKRVAPDTLDFTLLRAAELAEDNPAMRLLQLVGADPRDTSLLSQRLAGAIGMSGSAAPTDAELEARLRKRGEHDLLELFAAARQQL